MFYLTSELLLSALIFILVFTITYGAIYKLFKDKLASIITSSAIGILSIIYLTQNQLDQLFKAYGIGGIFLMITIPWMIAFFFIYSSKIGGLLRKLIWIFFGTITIILLNKSPNETNNWLIPSIVIITILLLISDKIIKEKFSFKKNMRRR